MKSQHREQLSALLDGETDQLDDLDRLLAQADTCASYGELCRGRALLHGECCEHLPADFSERVAAALAREPVVLNPAASRVAAPAAPTARAAPRARGGRWMPTAIAASVALLGFAALLALSGRETQRPGPVLSAGAPTAIDQAVVRPVAADVRRIDVNRLSPRLRAELLHHLDQLQQAESGRLE